MRNVYILVLLLVLTVPAIKSLLVPGAYTSHDLTHHIIRQIDMDKLLSEGQFPPRWSGDLNKGYGYPLFLFNYPLPPMVGEVFHKLGLGYIESVKAVLLMSMVISVVGMYIFLFTLLKSKSGAFAGAIFYLYAPVRFINIYVSAAVGSALALGILPFVFLALVRLYRKKTVGNIVLGSISLFALITSHNVTTLIFLPLIIIFSGILVYQSKQKLLLFKSYLGMFVLGFGLAAFFWLPALIEKSYTRYDVVLPRFWADHFPTFWQLIRSPWGYGLSNPGPNDSLSFQIGLIHIAVMLLIFLLFWFLRKNKEFLLLGIFSVVFFTISIFLMLDISRFFWDRLPMLGYVQFPSRFLAVSVFSASIAAALLIKYLPFKKVLLLLLVVVVLYANRNHLNVNQRLDYTDSYYQLLDTTSTMAGEHLPPWGDLRAFPSPGKFEIIEGSGQINIIENKSAKVVANVDANTEVKLRFNQIYFPGWEITNNGEKINFNYLETGENYSLPTFAISSGKNLIQAEFKNTFIRNIGDTLSIISLGVFLVLSIKLVLIVKSRKYQN